MAGTKGGGKKKRSSSSVAPAASNNKRRAKNAAAAPDNKQKGQQQQHQGMMTSFFPVAKKKKNDENHHDKNATLTASATSSSTNNMQQRQQEEQQQQEPNNNNNQKKQKMTPVLDSIVDIHSKSIAPTYIKEPYTAGDSLQIITDPQAMFDDMIQTKVCKHSYTASLLKSLLQKLHNRPLRVATMCSGTESPLLALDMLQKSIQQACLGEHADMLLGNSMGSSPMDSSNDTTDNDNDFLDNTIMQLEHVFSCEIEPFKQGYIERNFHPPLLFRDIRELGMKQAYTAYGALVDVPNTPGCVDILIAGTSCVDYSNLNNKKKEMEDLGESGATFEGMKRWIQKAEPPIVILENVYGAPWDKKVKLFDELGYSADYLKLDTKDYYIPHTRQRGYLFAIRKLPSRKEGQKRLDGRPQQWKNLVQQFKRPASAPLDAYLFSNDDPRVLRGRARLTAAATMSSDGEGGNRAGRTDWTKCET